MVKNSESIKGGVTIPKNAKPAEQASKNVAAVATATSKLNAETTKKDPANLRKRVPSPSKEEQVKKSSLEIDGLFGQLRGATSAAATTTKVRNATFW